MIDFILSNKWAAWLVAGLVFLIIELSTTALVSIWFVPSAVITAVCSLFIKSIYLQVLIFVALSVVFLFLSKKLYKKHKSEAEDASTLMIGKTAVAVQRINQDDGKVLVGDIYWRAVSDEDIGENDTVTVKSVNGTTLVVSKKI